MDIQSSLFKNCYRHWYSPVLRNGYGADSIMHIREGVEQGEPLAMAAYGLGILPLIKNLKGSHPDATKPWYSDNTGALGRFLIIEDYFNYLTQVGLYCGYFPDLKKPF